jgi:histidinol dehydrogenase
MKIIQSEEFDSYWKTQTIIEDDTKTEETVKEIINEVRANGDSAVRGFASKFDKSSPQKLEVPITEAKRACELLRANEPELAEAVKLSAVNISRFSMLQREQFADFEVEADTGLFTGQRVIPVERAAVYIPGGRFPLFSSVLMCMIPAFCAGVNEVILSSPPAEDGMPNQKILAAAGIAIEAAGIPENRLRIFAIGGAQAIAALAFGTESVPRVDVIAGPGNRFV